jgi:5S rRNA maturation endonuclease (ribonuclease M5)
MFPRTKQEMIEELKLWVEGLNEKGHGAIIVVEGKKDVSSLRKLVIYGRICHMNKCLSVLTYLESLERGDKPFEELGGFETIIILTDWDRTGGRLARKLKEACQNLGIQFDIETRRDISRITGKWVRDVESLDSLIS